MANTETSRQHLEALLAEHATLSQRLQALGEDHALEQQHRQRLEVELAHTQTERDRLALQVMRLKEAPKQEEVDDAFRHLSDPDVQPVPYLRLIAEQGFTTAVRWMAERARIT